MTTYQEVEQQIETIEAKRGELLSDVTALGEREKALRAARSDALAREFFDRQGQGTARKIDAELEQISKRAGELRELLSVADDRIAGLRAMVNRVHFDALLHDYPEMVRQANATIAEYKATRARLLQLAGAVNREADGAGHAWLKIQSLARGLGETPEAWAELPSAPGVFWNDPDQFGVELKRLLAAR